MSDRETHPPSDHQADSEATLEVSVEVSVADSALDGDQGPRTPDTRPPVRIHLGVGGVDVGTVARYQLRKELGRGGMGVVYRAHDAELGRDVALKVLQPGLHGSGHRRKRFMREARAVARLRHSNIVQIHDIGIHEDTAFFTMELVDGPTLTRVARTHSFDARQAAAVAIRLARALAYAHGHGLIHRDVKPGNVLLDTSGITGDSSDDRAAVSRLGRPVLTDFGLVKDMHANDETTLQTRDGALLGTLEYMAPEQLRGDIDAIGPHSDQYALGVVLWELASGHRPYSGSTPAQLIEMILGDEAPVLDHADVPIPLRRICEKALARAPGARYRDCAALADDLERFLAGEPVLAGARGIRWHARRLVRRYHRALAILCLVAVCVGAAVWALGALGEWRATRAERARQAAAEQRRVAMQARVDALTADDPPTPPAMAEAERAFAGFIELEANAETRALARAWLDRAALLERRSQASGDDAAHAAQAAYATAYDHSQHRAEQTEALLGLAERFRKAYRWRALEATVATLLRREQDLATHPRVLHLRRHLALAQRRIADAGALVASGSSAAEQRDARLLVRLGRATQTPHRARVAAHWDIDRDGAAELVLADSERTGLTVVAADEPALPVRLHLELPDAKRPVQRLDPLTLPATESPTLLVTEQGGRARLMQLSFAQLEQVAPVFLGSIFGSASGDLDGDGTLDHYVARNTHLLSLKRRSAGAFDVASSLSSASTANTYLRDLAIADLDGDGRSELLAATAGWGGYGVRAYHAGPQGLQLAARHQLGKVVQVEVIRAPGELRAAVIQEHDPAVPLDRNLFPGDGPHCAARGLHVLARTGDGWQPRTSMPLGVLSKNPRGRRGAQMMWVWPKLLAGDLDGDQLDDLVAVFEGTWMVIYHQQPDGAFSELIVDGAVPLAIRDIDGDGAAELIVHTADAAAEVWVLGLGDDVLPPVRQIEDGADARAIPHESAIDLERDVEPALRERWRRAEELGSMGLPLLAAERFEHIADMASGTFTEARALFRAGAMVESTMRLRALATLESDLPLSDASALYRRAARAARASSPPAQPPEDSLARIWDAALRCDLADQRHRAALDAARSRLSLPGAREDLPATIRRLEALLGMSSTVLDFTAGLDGRWRVHRPVDVRLDRRAGGLRVRTLGNAPLLTLPVRRTGGPMRITLDASAERTDWAGAFYLALIADADRLRSEPPRRPDRSLRVFQWEKRGGGAVYFERLSCAGLAPQRLDSGEDSARRRLTWESLGERRGGHCDVVFPDRTLRGVFPEDAWADAWADVPGDATLVIGGASLDEERALTESLLYRLELVGLDIREEPTAPLSRAHHQLAIGRPDLALGTLDTADETRAGRSVAADAARAIALVELEQTHEARSTLIAALERDPDLGGLVVPLMHHLDSFGAIMRAAMGPGYYLHYFAAYNSASGLYPDETRESAALVSHLDGVEELPFDTFANPADALVHLVHLARRGAALRLSNRAARGLRSLKRARELGRYWLQRLALMDEPEPRSKIRHELAVISVELAIIYAQRGERDQAITSLLTALAIAPAPAVHADNIANRDELEVLHTHPGWIEVRRARKVGRHTGLPAAEATE